MIQLDFTNGLAAYQTRNSAMDPVERQAQRRLHPEATASEAATAGVNGFTLEPLLPLMCVLPDLSFSDAWNHDCAPRLKID